MLWILLSLLLPSLAFAPSAGAASGPAGVSAVPLMVPSSGRSGFQRIEASLAGIGFTNRLNPSLAAQNQILLNGSGVAAGDIDGDGLCDLYFCSLTEGNHLYRNLGNWQFTEITASAGVGCEGQFSTGACLVDLDGDGDLDLLVNSLGGGTRSFRNEGGAKFIERPEAGLRRTGGSHSFAIADVDGDGDLDVYVTNYRTTTVRDNPIRVRLRQVDGKLVVPPPYTDRFLVHVSAPGKGSLIELGEADVLYRNEGNGRFTAVDWTSGFFLDEAGKPLPKAPLDWGLSALFHDLNGDHRPDLFVCNDFSSPDRLWFGNPQGKLQAAPSRTLRHTSWASMSVDVADIDHDGFPDLFVSDMLSADLGHRQTQRGNSSPAVQPEDELWDRPQSLRNMLFWNQGDGTFREIAPFAGVEASEWTWGAVFLDVDLDGFEDLLLATGHGADMQDFDAAQRIAELRSKDPQIAAAALMTNYPVLHPPNVAFRNRGNLTFEASGAAWGFDRPGITHGIVLADLDNDGDLDVVTSDLNQSPGLYRNLSIAPRIAVRLRGKSPNTQAIGTSIRVLTDGDAQQKQIMSGGRYLSSDDTLRSFAANWVGETSARLEVIWPDGGVSRIPSVERNRLYLIDRSSVPISRPSESTGHSSRELFELQQPGPFPRYQEAEFDESVRQPLLPWPLARRGPRSLSFDVNQDGRPDVVLGGGRGGRPSIWLNSSKEGFQELSLPSGLTDLSGDITSVVGYVQSAGDVRILMALTQDELNDDAYSTILHLRIQGAKVSLLPWTDALPMSIGALALGDADGDGDPDLFVGGRMISKRYPEPAPSQWYRNDAGTFAPTNFGFNWGSLGLVTGAVMADLTRDGRPDLVAATEWGPLRLFVNTAQGFAERTRAFGLDAWRGVWTTLAAADLDADGVPELLVGNQGRNQLWNRFLAHPLRLYYGDLNQNGALATLLSVRPSDQERYFPLNDLNALKRLVPRLGQQFPTHAEYARASIDSLFAAAGAPPRYLEANLFDHGFFKLSGESFKFIPFPTAAQITSLNGIGAGDLDGDGHTDLYLAQNRPALELDPVRQDSGTGLLLRGDGRGALAPLGPVQTGIRLYGEQHGVSIADWNLDGSLDVLVGEAGAAPKLYLRRSH